MSREEIEKQIRNYLAGNFLHGRTDALAGDTVLLGNIIDSTGTLELIAFLQKNFSIRVDDDDMIPENLDSISRLSAYVESKLATRS